MPDGTTQVQKVERNLQYYRTLRQAQGERVLGTTNLIALRAINTPARWRFDSRNGSFNETIQLWKIALDGFPDDFHVDLVIGM
jgi:hypothetical protein